MQNTLPGAVNLFVFPYRNIPGVGFHHLKRVKKDEENPQRLLILHRPVASDESLPLQDLSSMPEAERVIVETRTVRVSEHEAVTPAQLQDWGVHWPMVRSIAYSVEESMTSESLGFPRSDAH